MLSIFLSICLCSALVLGEQLMSEGLFSKQLIIPPYMCNCIVLLVVIELYLFGTRLLHILFTPTGELCNKLAQLIWRQGKKCAWLMGSMMYGQPMLGCLTEHPGCTQLLINEQPAQRMRADRRCSLSTNRLHKVLCSAMRAFFHNSGQQTVLVMLMWYTICDCLDTIHLNIGEAASYTSACPNTLCWISSSQFSTVLSAVVKTNVMGYFITDWPALIIQKIGISKQLFHEVVFSLWVTEGRVTSQQLLHSGSAEAPSASCAHSFQTNKATLLHLDTRSCHLTRWWQIHEADVTCLYGKSQIDKLPGNSELTRCIS